jgi:hypothetical protein
MSMKKLPGKFVIHTKRFYASEAYWNLNGSAKNVLEIFYLKRQLINGTIAKKLNILQDSAKMVRNNGEIIFTYDEAKGYGISKDVFTRSIDKLIEVGFIDIAEIGGNRIPSKYGLSDRWLNYGNSNFEKKERQNKYKKNTIGENTRFKKKKKNEKTNDTRNNKGEFTRNNTGVKQKRIN